MSAPGIRKDPAGAGTRYLLSVGDAHDVQLGWEREGQRELLVIAAVLQGGQGVAQRATPDPQGPVGHQHHLKTRSRSNYTDRCSARALGYTLHSPGSITSDRRTCITWQGQALPHSCCTTLLTPCRADSRQVLS